MSRLTAKQDPCNGREQREISLRFDAFTWDAINEECARLGVSAQELISFATLYYLADADSGRVSRDITRSPFLSSERTGMAADSLGDVSARS